MDFGWAGISFGRCVVLRYFTMGVDAMVVVDGLSLLIHYVLGTLWWWGGLRDFGWVLWFR